MRFQNLILSSWLIFPFALCCTSHDHEGVKRVIIPALTEPDQIPWASLLDRDNVIFVVSLDTSYVSSRVDAIFDHFLLQVGRSVERLRPSQSFAIVFPGDPRPRGIAPRVFPGRPDLGATAGTPWREAAMVSADSLAKGIALTDARKYRPPDLQSEITGLEEALRLARSVTAGTKAVIVITDSDYSAEPTAINLLRDLRAQQADVDVFLVNVTTHGNADQMASIQVLAKKAGASATNLYWP